MGPVEEGGNDEAKEDLGVRLEGEGETEPSTDEDVEASGGVGETDQSIVYVMGWGEGKKGGVGGSRKRGREGWGGAGGRRGG